MAKILRTEVAERLMGRLDVKKEIVNEIKVDWSTLFVWIKKNEVDGPLTKLAIADIIASRLNLSYEQIYQETNQN